MIETAQNLNQATVTLLKCLKKVLIFRWLHCKFHNSIYNIISALLQGLGCPCCQHICLWHDQFCVLTSTPLHQPLPLHSPLTQLESMSFLEYLRQLHLKPWISQQLLAVLAEMYPWSWLPLKLCRYLKLGSCRHLVLWRLREYSYISREWL